MLLLVYGVHDIESEASESKMVRKPCRSDMGSGLNKGAWTPQEDLLLKNYVEIHGEGQWRILPHKTGLLRCGRTCRLRCMNYLRPDVKHDSISADEEELIIRLHKLLGNRWSLIAARMPGRTDNQVKNVWYSLLRKIPAKTATQYWNTQKPVLKPVPYKYKLLSPKHNYATHNAEIFHDHNLNDNPNLFLFLPTNYASGNGELDQMKQAGASPDIEELITKFPVLPLTELKDVTLIEMHSPFLNSNGIMDRGFCWASSSMSPLHIFSTFLTSSNHLEGIDDAYMGSSIHNGIDRQIVNNYDHNQKSCDNIP